MDNIFSEKESKELKAAKNLNKEILGDIGKSIIELEKETLTDEELRNRAGDIEVFYETHFKKILALKEIEWLRSLGTNAETPGQIIWHRGAIHCLNEMKLWCENQVKISRSRFQKEEESEPGKIFPPVGEE